MLNFSELISGWDKLTPREKFNAVAKYQKAHRHIKPKIEKPKATKSIKIKTPKEIFEPIPGYYQREELINELKISYSTIKRYIQKGNVREYRVGKNVAYCLYDLIIEKENAKNIRRQNCAETNRKRRGIK